ncbi:hypothetical protein [Kosakonia pseudosacchari]|uniref:Uncharacterized protein n=1 Tax=Kosakonia pseudosacchari TaxID=1646340 RepID=A0ABX4IN78_9ENTR|nr:hypothetical protein [Kosakonia pseudosacchari]PDO85656.1 hypothetical protein BK796_14215 [Kosakonia pseudosacchari]QOV61947.1 hypothetical protein IP581_11610 [Kosakonia pseudosacchari]WBU51525.1 hypothetical protein PF050_11650 [Kosakonia pseudosacchari]
MINLVQTPYDLNSGYPIVRRTLEDKKKLVKHEGFGPESCCATIEYTLRGNSRYAFGNSQMQVEMPPNIYAHNWVKLHGEMTALVAAIRRIERVDSTSAVLPITSAYIELRPCEASCLPALHNMLPDNITVYFSFLHPTQVDQWKQSARALCAA